MNIQNHKLGKCYRNHIDFPATVLTALMSSRDSIVDLRHIKIPPTVLEKLSAESYCNEHSALERQVMCPPRQTNPNIRLQTAVCSCLLYPSTCYVLFSDCREKKKKHINVHGIGIILLFLKVLAMLCCLLFVCAMLMYDQISNAKFVT